MFGEWYTTLIESVQDDIVRVVGLLEAKGVNRLGMVIEQQQ